MSEGVDEDVVLYHRHAAEHGDTSAQLALANVLLYGTHGLQADYDSAAHYYEYWLEALEKIAVDKALLSREAIDERHRHRPHDGVGRGSRFLSHDVS